MLARLPVVQIYGSPESFRGCFFSQIAYAFVTRGKPGSSLQKRGYEQKFYGGLFDSNLSNHGNGG